MGKNFLMNLEDFTIYFIIITFALYTASRYIKTESFQDGNNETTQAATMPPIRDWKYKWRQRRNELIPLYDPDEDGSRGLIFDAHPDRADSLRKTHASRLIDLYRLDENNSSNIIEPDVDDAEEEFWKEWRESRWRNHRDALLEILGDLNDAVEAGEADEASEEDQAAGRQAQQLITTYRLDVIDDPNNDNDDDNAADIIQPPELSDKVAATVAPDEVTPAPFNDIYLDNYVTPLRGIGCKMAPWGEEICKPDITNITLEDIDNKITQLTREIANEERDINISGGNVTINVDQDEANVERITPSSP